MMVSSMRKERFRKRERHPDDRPTGVRMAIEDALRLLGSPTDPDVITANRIMQRFGEQILRLPAGDTRAQALAACLTPEDEIALLCGGMGGPMRLAIAVRDNITPGGMGARMTTNTEMCFWVAQLTVYLALKELEKPPVRLRLVPDVKLSDVYPNGPGTSKLMNDRNIILPESVIAPGAIVELRECLSEEGARLLEHFLDVLVHVPSVPVTIAGGSVETIH